MIILATPAAVAAQPAALIALRAPGRDPAGQASIEAVRAALEKQGVALLDEATRAERTRRPGVDPAPSLQRAQTLEALAEALLDAAAFGRDAEVIRRGELELRAAEPELALVNRSDAAANALLDTCFLVVRALLHTRDEAAAARAAERCAWRVPDLSPHADLHPPNVIALAARARGTQQAVLRVIGSISSPEACRVRVQGRPMGALSSTLTLVPGRYAVQVDCEQPGFEHAVELRAGTTTTLELALDFEQRATDGHGSLIYSAARAADDLSGLSALARWLGVDELWIVSRDPRPTLARLQSSEGRLAVTATHALGPSEPLDSRQLASAVTALLCRDCGAADQLPPALSRVRIRVGLGLGALALAGVITSWGLRAAHQQLDDELLELSVDQPGYDDKRAQRDRVGHAAVATSSVGGALMVAASATGLPSQRPDPWSPAMIAAVSGLAAVSVGLIIGGAVALVRYDDDPERVPNCPEGASVCYRDPPRRTQGPMLLAQGLGLLSLPITYSWRALRERRSSVAVQASPSSFVALFRARL